MYLIFQSQIVMKVKPMQFNGQNMEIINKLQKQVRFYLLYVDYLLEGVAEYEKERNDGRGYSDQVGEFAGGELKVEENIDIVPGCREVDSGKSSHETGNS